MKVPKRATLAQIAKTLGGVQSKLDAHARSQGFDNWADMVDARRNEGKYA